MNFKRNFLTISALVGTVLLAGCTLRNVFSEYKYSDLVIDSHEEETKCDGAIFKKGDYDDYYAMDDDKLVNVGSFYDVMTKRTKLTVLPSEGEQKILVVPVEFKEEGTVGSYLGIKREEYVGNIQKAFFGDSKNNSYVSVAQFYDVSKRYKAKQREEEKIIIQNRNRALNAEIIEKWKLDYPEMMSEWDTEKNLDLLNVQLAKSRIAWWTCPIGHSYDMRISSRMTQRCGCPYSQPDQPARRQDRQSVYHPLPCGGIGRNVA